MHHLGFNLILPNAGLHKLEQPPEHLIGSVDGAIDEGDLLRQFDGSKLVHERGHPFEGVQGVLLPKTANKTGITGLHSYLGAGVFVGVEVNTLGLKYHLLHYLIELACPIN